MVCNYPVYREGATPSILYIYEFDNRSHDLFDHTNSIDIALNTKWVTKIN